MARFTVRPEHVERARRLVADLVAEVRQHEPATRVYESFQLWDTSSFVHVMTFADEAAEQRHRTAPYTRRFVDALYPLCETAPVFSTLSLIASNVR